MFVRFIQELSEIKLELLIIMEVKLVGFGCDH